MRGYFFPTDFEWFSFLAAQPELDEVNFWRPSATPFRALKPGEPLFFKLKAPHNAVGGFGYFARYVVAPISMVWEAFQQKNGARDLPELRRQTSRLRTPPPGPREDYPLGCIMVSSPIFFPRERWIPQPSDYPPQAVSGRGYSLEEGEVRQLYERCLQLADRDVYEADVAEPTAAGVAELRERYGELQRIKPRLGQGAFRLSVVDAYGRACAVSEEHSLPVLEAAHIRPYGAEGAHALNNGILLRTDIHKLFDRGYVTVDPDYRFVVSRRLKEDFDNGRTYYAYQGKSIRVPALPVEQPAKELLRWHNENVFFG